MTSPLVQGFLDEILVLVLLKVLLIGESLDMALQANLLIVYVVYLANSHEIMKFIWHIGIDFKGVNCISLIFGVASFLILEEVNFFFEYF